MVGNGLGPSGLTMGPLAGRLLAQLVLGQTLELDLAAYDPLQPGTGTANDGSYAIR